MGNGSATCGRFRGLARITAAAALLALFAPAAAESRARDRDRDGLSDRYELKKSHTGVRRADTDRDVLKDGYEIRRSKTSPRRADTDRDGLSDGFELKRSKTHPRKRDTDRDGMNDGLELVLGRDPRKPDLQGDPTDLGAPALQEIDVAPGLPVPDLPLPDLLPPDTIITTGPSGTVATGSVSFSFASSEPESTFECRLDSGAWSDCSSPKAYSGLADGSYTFAVRTIDEAGNTDLTPATRTFAVDLPEDTTAPNTSITGGPSGTVASTSASFEFTSSESGSTFECRLDGGAWASCASPKSYSGLGESSHTFAVRAMDAAGNTDASPASRTWTISNSTPGDTAPPDTSISSGPSGTVTTRAASFAFASTESGSTFECRLDGGAWAACTSPRAYSNVVDGAHTFSVRASDAAGNTDASPASRSWTVDATAPSTSIESGPSGSVNSTSASFGFSANESGSSFECRIDGGAWGACTSPKAYSGGLAEGPHTFNVRATDVAGNVDGSPASRAWTIDTAAPNTSITSGPSGTSTSSSASFGFSSSETGSTFQCRVDSGSWGSCTSPKTYSALANGSHTFDVRATDVAGNQDGSPASQSWIVAATDPGPDPGTNCMRDPSACGYPDVENTGVEPGVTLTPVSGSVTLSTAGQVYENKLVTGQITVTAPNVTIRNVKLVATDDWYGIKAFGWNSNPDGLLLEHVEIDLSNKTTGKGIAFDGYTARNVFFHNGSDCAHFGSGVVIEDSLCVSGPDANDDGWPDGSGFCDGPDHFDGLQSDGGDNITIRHNTIRNPCGQTSAILMSTNTSGIRNVTIEDNLLAGGGYTLYCNAGPDVPNQTVTGNRFSTYYFAKGGYWGPTTGCDDADVFSGNVWDENNQPLGG